MIHAYRTLLVADPIADFVPLLPHGSLVDGRALVLGRRVGVAALDLVLDAIAGVAAGCRPRGCRDVATRAAAYVVPEQAADHRSTDGAEDLVRVARRALLHHGFIVAALFRRADGVSQRSDAHHVRILRRPVHDLETGDGACAHGQCCAGRGSNPQRLAHRHCPSERMRYADWPAVERAGIYVRPAGSKKLVGALAETAAGLFQP